MSAPVDPVDPPSPQGSDETRWRGKQWAEGKTGNSLTTDYLDGNWIMGIGCEPSVLMLSFIRIESCSIRGQ